MYGIFALGFVLYEYCSPNNFVSYKRKTPESKIQKIMYYFYKPFVIPTCLITCVIIELILSRGVLTWSYYLIFMVIITKGFFTLLETLLTTTFIYDVATSNYYNHNFKNSRYPRILKFMILNPEYHFR